MPSSRQTGFLGSIVKIIGAPKSKICPSQLSIRIYFNLQSDLCLIKPDYPDIRIYVERKQPTKVTMNCNQVTFRAKVTEEKKRSNRVLDILGLETELNGVKFCFSLKGYKSS